MVCVGNDGDLQGKLIDFGVTLRLGDWERSCRTVGKVGTYPFFCPEMCYNKRPHQAERSKVRIQDFNSFDARLNDVWCLGHALWGYAMGVLLFQDISSTDARFTVATRALYSTEPEKWQGKNMGLRYLAKRYGSERNQMATDELIDLLEHMLAPEAERYTIAQCLQHPWFQTKSAERHAPSTPRTIPKLV
jgi:serine/threonine protein kinase